MNDLIPPPDPLGIPSPPFIFEALGWLTLVLHFIFMGYVLGGSIYIMINEWFAGQNSTKIENNSLLIKVMPVALSFAITMGVAPLLFVQVLYGQFFYSANVMMGGWWMLILLCVIIAFYSLYILIYKRPHPAQSTGLTKLLSLSNVILFLIVAFIFTNNALLVEHPEYWPEIYAKQKSFIAPDVTLIPRYLHNLFAGLVIAGIWCVAIGRYRLVYHPAHSVGAQQLVRSGLIWAIIALLLQIVDGFILLFALGTDMVRQFMGNGYLFVGWSIAVVTAVIAAILLIMAIINQDNKKFIWGSVGLIFLTVFGMIMGRDLVRILSLQEYFTIYDLAVRPSISSFILFLGTFLVGLVVVGYLIYLVMTLPPKEEQTDETSQGY